MALMRLIRIGRAATLILNQQAFIQILDGKNLKTNFIKFPFDQFSSDHKRFIVDIANNQFSLEHIKLNLTEAQGEITFEDQVPWPSTFLSPGIMGPFTFVPFMECYHGILSMDHKLSGSISIDGRSINFDGGRGYIEKDWGHSFPSAYIWMQSNHFKKEGVSIKASVAKIPWLTGAFVGFIAGLYLDGKLYQFTTYNSTKLIKSLATHELVHIIMQNKKYKLEIRAIRDHSTELAAPIHGFMDGRISESMTAQIQVQLTERKSRKVIFSDVGKHAGLEVAGKIEEITIE